jgi:hypothetical protein
MQEPTTFRESWRQMSIGSRMVFGLALVVAAVIISQCRTGQRLYGFSMVGRNGNTVLDMARARIVFEGVPHSGRTDGTIGINGWGWERSYVGEARRPFEQKSVRGVTTIQFAGFTIEFTDNATRLVYGTNVFPLSNEKKTILLRRDGSAAVLQDDSDYRQ